MLFPETLDTLKKLKSLELKLGIISNFDSRIYPVLESLDIRDFFDAVIISSEVGYAKPSPQIFRAAVQALAVPADEILMVGDSLDDDVDAAARCGLKAILVDRRNRHAAAPFRRISLLTEIVHEVTS